MQTTVSPGTQGLHGEKMSIIEQSYVPVAHGREIPAYDCLPPNAAMEKLQPLCPTLLSLPPWFRAVINFNLISLQQFK
jgi:hypothetical protein